MERERAVKHKSTGLRELQLGICIEISTSRALNSEIKAIKARNDSFKRVMSWPSNSIWEHTTTS